jgi:hypothetical protein
VATRRVITPAQGMMNPAYKRIYHYHVRKTGGTSMNAAFWALGGFDSLACKGRHHSLVGRSGLRLVGGDLKLISEGDYFFAHSHAPAHLVSLPPDTFTITILRDPVARLMSYYRYLLWARANPGARDLDPAIDWVRMTQSTMLDGRVRRFILQVPPRRRAGRARSAALRRLPYRTPGSFQNLMKHIPPQHLLNQLYMFSERLDPVEAADNALACSAVCFTETFEDDLGYIAHALDLNLEAKRERSFGDRVQLDDDEIAQLRERLAPEYKMLERVRAGRKVPDGDMPTHSA